jgi:DNA-binding XRE family transcriptional regulator
MTPQMANRVRVHRRKSGLSQSELAAILGTLGPVGISRHEQSATLPKILVAAGYEIVFRVPIADLFPGVYETLRLDIEARLLTFEEELHKSTAKGREATLIARKLEWLWERRNRETVLAANENQHQ